MRIKITKYLIDLQTGNVEKYEPKTQPEKIEALNKCLYLLCVIEKDKPKTWVASYYYGVKKVKWNNAPICYTIKTITENPEKAKGVATKWEIISEFC